MNNEKAHGLILQKETLVLENKSVVSWNEKMGMYQIHVIDRPHDDDKFTTCPITAMISAYVRINAQFSHGRWERSSWDFVKPEGDNQ